MTAIRLRPALRILALALLPLFSCLTMFGQLVQSEGQTIERPNAAPPFRVMTHPREYRLQRGRAFNGDVRTLPQTRPQKFERPEFEEPEITPVPYPGTVATPQASSAPVTSGGPSMNPPAPSASSSFEGLDFANWGAGHPPDTNGDVGPTHYVQTINTSVGIYRKSDGVRLAAFTFNTLMSQGHFGNLCDTNNFGDPVVVYDTFEDRWIITDFAFILSGGAIVAPAFQCFAVSKSGDPVGGGWNFYSIQVNDAFPDYPKFGIWSDGLYMSANMFGFDGSGAFHNVRVWAFNKAQMYAGAPTVQILSFDAPSAEFTLLPSNARLQTGTPPTGSPNYFAVVAQFLNAISIYKLHVDWNKVSTSTFSGPFISITSTSWSLFTGMNSRVPSPANPLDTLYPRLMVQNQYSNIGGAESLWDSHTVGASGTTSAQTGVRYYQVDVTGGTVAANAPQAFTYNNGDTINRFMPSVAVDRVGDMAIGYSVSTATLNPAIRYAGRLASDPINSIPQTETSLIEGTGSQTVTNRWGDYSAMTLDPDGCTFWYTNMYYQVTGGAFNTRIGAFGFPSCTPAGTGTLQGTVTASGSGTPLQGVSVALGNRTTTTDVNGLYSFTGLPSGTYPSLTASFPGYNSITVTNIVINDSSTTTQDFALTLAPGSGCLTDTTQADFQGGIPTKCDLNSSPGDVVLLSGPQLDQQNANLLNAGFFITATSWSAQTFKPSVTGQLMSADVNLFCNGCTGTTPDLTLSVRATSGGLPTGPDLASGTITGFFSGPSYHSVTFGSPPTLTAGTTYALIVHPVSNPSVGNYVFTVSGTPNPYANGNRVTSVDSGTTWASPATVRSGGFHTFMNAGFTTSGIFVSSPKDVNPLPTKSPRWDTLSWTASTPASTAIQFQAAASDSIFGPFNFVGPDGTAGTFFTNGGSLAQFNGKRYLKYQASLTTSDSTVTPALNDVTACFHTADKTGTTTTLTSSVNPSTFGQSVTFTATVAPAPPDGELVTFKDGINSLGTGALSSGVATFTTSALAAGSHTMTAVYAGDDNVLGSTGSLDTNPQVVNKADTMTTVTSSLNPSVFGQSVTFTATVAAVPPGAGTPTGTVTFLDGGNPIITRPLSGGVATFTTSALVPGSHTITTSYAGDANFNGSTGSLTGNQVVNKANTTTPTVTSSVNPSVFGQFVTFTATVTASAPGAGTPTGIVLFKDGVSTIGSGPLSGGVATFSTSTLSVGIHTITTTYGGDANFNGSNGSLTGNQVVNKASTIAVLSSNNNPSTFGQSVTFTATVAVASPGSGTATGTVTFKDGASTLGTGTLSGGVATFTTSALAAGNHIITGVYGGDANFTGTTGSLDTNPQIVNQSGTTTVVVSNNNPSIFGQSVMFTATITAVPPGAGTPTGTVTFKDGASTLGPGTLSGGVATFTTSALTAGSHSITAVYGGDANFTTSTSPVLTQVVQGTDVSVTLTHVPDPANIGGKLTFSAVVQNNGPDTANVTFTETFVGSSYVVSTNTTLGTCTGTGPISCNLGSMTNGQSATVTVVITPLPLIRTITATGMATPDVTDSNPANNTAINTVRVRFKPFHF